MQFLPGIVAWRPQCIVLLRYPVGSRGPTDSEAHKWYLGGGPTWAKLRPLTYFACSKNSWECCQRLFKDIHISGLARLPVLNKLILHPSNGFASILWKDIMSQETNRFLCTLTIYPQYLKSLQNCVHSAWVLTWNFSKLLLKTSLRDLTEE